WELVPHFAGGDELVAGARGAPEDHQAEIEARISARIRESLELPRLLDDDSRKPQKMDDFVRCIAAVYQERTASRWRIRKAVHPVTPKKVATLLREARSDASNDIIAEISAAIARDVQLHEGQLPAQLDERCQQRARGLLAWIDDLRKHGI